MNQLKTAFIYSGQGAQYNGMAKELFDNFASVRASFEEAGDTLGIDMVDLCFEDNSKLHFTPFTQPAVLTVSYAIDQLMKEAGVYPDAVGGLSLGEYTALVSAGVMTFKEAVALVHKRGQLMEEAVPSGTGKMAAIIGLEKETVEDICRRLSVANSVVGIANYNTPNQLVISGHSGAVEQASRLMDEAGAKRVVELKVSGPFHSPLLQPASLLLEKEIDKLTLESFAYPVYSNVTAAPYSNELEVKQLLVKQMTSPVKFEQMIVQMIEDGVESFIELGPGKTLRTFIKSINRNVNVKNVENVTQLNKILND